MTALTWRQSRHRQHCDCKRADSYSCALALQIASHSCPCECHKYKLRESAPVESAQEPKPCN
jgi:hypothetical protein